MLILLDTDTLSLLQKRHARLRARLAAHEKHAPDDEVCTTVISLQEQMQGRLAALNRPTTPDRLLTRYAELIETLESFSTLHVLPFDAAALARYDDLRAQRLCLGTMDLRIASIVLANGGRLITRNLRDFNRVPGLVAEDWTV